MPDHKTIIKQLITQMGRSLINVAFMMITRASPAVVTKPKAVMSHMPFNINGRINLLFCFFWGVLAIVWLKLLYPAVSRVIEKIPPVAGKVLTYILVFAMALDMLISSVALMRYVDRKQQTGADTAVEQFLDHTYPDSFIEWVYPNMKITD